MTKTTFTWKPTRWDGKLGEPGEFEAEQDDVDYCRNRYRQAMKLEDGPERSLILSEVRFFMDALAMFPGTRFVRSNLGGESAFVSRPAALSFAPEQLEL